MAHEDYAIRITMLVALGLSCVGCTFVCFVYLYFKDIRSYAFRLVFYMSLMDIGHAIGFFLPSSPSFWCKVQAAVTSYFSLSSVFWAGAIAFTLYQAVIKRRNDVERFELGLMAFACGVPLLAIVPPLVEGTYGPAEGWCWIIATDDSYASGTFWRFMTFYGPLWLTVAFNIFVYVSVIRSLRSQLALVLGENETTNKLLKRLRLYPMILIGCYTLATVNRVYQSIYRGKDWFPLTIAAVGIMCLSGFFNAIVYGLTDTVKERLQDWWRSISQRKDSQTLGQEIL